MPRNCDIFVFAIKAACGGVWRQDKANLTRSPFCLLTTRKAEEMFPRVHQGCQIFRERKKRKIYQKYQMAIKYTKWL
jgi:hypothetical protein